jgi:hypothetical protein
MGILLEGERVNPEPVKPPGQKGMPKRGKALNTLNRLVEREEEVLAFGLGGVQPVIPASRVQAVFIQVNIGCFAELFLEHPGGMSRVFSDSFENVGDGTRARPPVQKGLETLH